MPTDRTFMVSIVEGPIRPLSTGALFPEIADVHVYELNDTSLVVTLRLQAVDGHPVLIGFAIEPNGPAREIGASEIHKLPVDELVALAVQAVAVEVAAATPHPFRRDPAVEGEAAIRARRRRATTDALLAEVARIFTAEENRFAPTRAVSEQLHCSYRTAGRWVAEARERELLPRLKEANETPTKARE